MAITEELRVAIEVQAARAVANLERYNKAAQKSTKQTSDFASIAKKAAGFIGGAAIAGAITKAASSSIKFAAAIEKQRASFETLLGSAGRANKFFNEIRDFSAATPFALPDLTKGAQRLLAFGTAADDVVDKLEQLGNAAQGDTATLERLVDAYGKVQARGRATLEDLNRFTEAGVPIMEALTEQTGLAGEELFKFISTGQVGFEELDQAIVGLTTGTGDFAGLLEKQSQTLSGLFSTAKDNLNLLGAELADVFLPAIKQVVEGFTNITKSITTFVRNNRGRIEGLIANFPEVAKLVFGRVLEIARDAIRFENLRDVIVAIGAGIIRILSRTWDELLTIFIERLKILVEPFRAIGDILLGVFRAVWDRIRNLGIDAINRLTGNIRDSGIGKLLSDTFGLGFEEIEREAARAFPNVAEEFDKSVDNVLTSASKIAAAIKEIGMVGVDELGQVGRDIGDIFDDEKAAAFRAELDRLLTSVQQLEEAGPGGLVLSGGGEAPDTGGFEPPSFDVELTERQLAELTRANFTAAEVIKKIWEDTWKVEYPKTIEEAAERTKASLRDIGNIAKDVFSRIVGFSDARREREIANLEKELEAFQEKGEEELAFKQDLGLDTEEFEAQLAEQTAAREAEIEKKKNDLEKRKFNRDKAIGIAQATIAGAQAFVRALTAGPIIGPILAGAIAGLTAAQIGLIAAQQFPGFAAGADFTTTGPTAFVAGEGGRRERVRIDPQPDNRMDMGSPIVINVDSVIGAGTVDDFLIEVEEGMERLRAEGRI